METVVIQSAIPTLSNNFKMIYMHKGCNEDFDVIEELEDTY
jgi:hypothetical protein